MVKRGGESADDSVVVSECPRGGLRQRMSLDINTQVNGWGDAVEAACLCHKRHRLIRDPQHRGLDEGKATFDGLSNEVIDRLSHGRTCIPHGA